MDCGLLGLNCNKNRKTKRLNCSYCLKEKKIENYFVDGEEKRENQDQSNKKTMINV